VKKDENNTKMDIIAHFHIRLDFNMVREILSVLTFSLFYYCAPLQMKNYMMLNNSERVILTTDI